MIRRWPLFAALLPLLAGLAVYSQLWRGWAGDFEARLAGWLGRPVVATGFPYRLETELGGVRWQHRGGVALSASAQRLRLNQGPWRPELTVMQGQGIALSAALLGLSAHLDAAVGTASLKLEDDRLARLSLVLPGARGNAGLGPDFVADTLELHGRERTGAAPAPADPALPAHGQLVLAATGLRLGQGAPIDVEGELLVRADARLTDLARWAATGGSADLTLTGRDATGEVFRLSATIVPATDGPRLAGTIDTVCPLAVAAAIGGTVPAAEQRLRAPVRLQISTMLKKVGPAAVPGISPDIANRPRRGQVPACPRLT